MPIFINKQAIKTFNFNGGECHVSVNEILKSCCGRLRNKVLYTSLPLHLVGTTFTLVELQDVYEVLLDEALDAKSFRRRMLSAEIIEETGKMKLGSRRPAKLHRRVPGTNTHFFLRNIEASSD